MGCRCWPACIETGRSGSSSAPCDELRAVCDELFSPCLANQFLLTELLHESVDKGISHPFDVIRLLDPGGGNPQVLLGGNGIEVGLQV